MLPHPASERTARKLPQHSAKFIAVLQPGGSPKLTGPGCTLLAVRKVVFVLWCAMAVALWGAMIAGSAAASPPQCRTTQFAARISGSIAGLGHRGVVLILTNRSSRSCRTRGYVGLLRLDAHHRPLPTVVHRGSGYLFESPQPRTLLLSPGESVSAGVEWLDASGPTDPPDCPVAGRFLEVTPPNQRSHLMIHANTGDCDAGFMSTTALQLGANGPRT